MQSLEWTWKMREGTLNLDTRRNVFFRKDPFIGLTERRNSHRFFLS